MSLGLHLEGPFINREKKGAHPENLIQSYEKNGFSDVEKMYTSLDNVSIVTVAPEIPYSDQVIQELTKRSIQVSLGKNWNFSVLSFFLYIYELLYKGSLFVFPYNHITSHLALVLYFDVLMT